MDKIKLLFVEDDASFAFVVKGSLELTGKYDVFTASNGKEGLEAYPLFVPDVIVSDIEMPELNGMEMVRQIRVKNKEVPILFATGHTSPQDVLKGYELEVDNFIKKPFLPDELDAHICAILKRSKKASALNDSRDIAVLGEFTFNVGTRTLQWKDVQHKLTQREAQILWKLCQHKGELVKRSELLEEFWGHDDFFTSRSLAVFIRTLRVYLANDPTVEIETIRGEGVKLII